MHTTQTLFSNPSNPIRATFLATAAVISTLACIPRAQATGEACDTTAACAAPQEASAGGGNYFRLSTVLQAAAGSGAEPGSPRTEMSDQEFFSFSGVGAIVCTVNGEHRTSNAFLVGAFDIGVTVSHTFASDGKWAQPENCVYTSVDSLGQIRERIPVSYIKAQWANEYGAFGETAKDFAVVRLSQPSRYAQRTMPLGKFSGTAASVLMIGFKADLDTDTIKRKSRGTVYDRRPNSFAVANLGGFTHDMDARGIAAGAPVIDERTGIIIGIHTALLTASTSPAAALTQRNTMITMNDWLEQTLRVEMATSEKNEPADSGS